MSSIGYKANPPGHKPKHPKKRKVDADEKTLKTLFGLGNIQATTKECAAVLGIAEITFFEFLHRSPEAKDAYERGKDQGKTSLRRTQFRLAETSAGMAIFLGKNLLGQRDDHGIHHTGKVNYDLTKATDAQLDAIESALAPLITAAVPGPADGGKGREDETRH